MPHRDQDINETPGNEAPPTVGSILLLIRQDIKGMKKDIEDLRATLDTKYVTHDQFWPVKAIVYGGAGIVLVAVMTYLVNSALRDRQDRAAAPATSDAMLSRGR